MRDMTNPNDKPFPSLHKRRPGIVRIRPWVQTVFLTVWLGPLGLRLHSIPGCVFSLLCVPTCIIRLSHRRDSTV